MPSTETTTAKKTVKKVTKSAKKATPKKVTKKPVDKEKKAADRAKAKAVGLGVIHYSVLRALGRNPKTAERLSYRDIEKLTGYYNMLAGILHTDEEYSLVALGLAKLGTEAREREVTIFSITAKGRKLLAKAG